MAFPILKIMPIVSKEHCDPYNYKLSLRWICIAIPNILNAICMYCTQRLSHIETTTNFITVTFYNESF